MSLLQPFAFEREFSAPPTAVEPPEDVVAAALATAEARGFAAGQAAAQEQCRAERASAVAASLAAMAEALAAIDRQAQQLAARLEEPAAALAVAAGELLAGRAHAEQPAGAVRIVLADLLGELRRGLPIELWVHPELLSDVTDAVAELQRGERRQRSVSIKTDEQLNPGDARVAWDGGGALIDAEARRAKLAQMLRETVFGD